MKRFLPILPILCFALALPAAEPAPRIVRSADGQILTIDYPNVEISVILDELANTCDLSVVIPEMSGRTSVRLRNVTWRQVLNLVLTPQGYSFVEDNGIVRVCTVAALVRSGDG